MQGFDGLVKEIDSLTYNARSVLNALIRSVMRSGSSSGYTVTRKVNSVPYTIKLTRGDIYILSQFYSKWEELGFSSTSGFSEALIYADALKYYEEPAASESTSAKSTLLTKQATPALVRHSEMLFLSADNVSNYATSADSMTDTQKAYWLGLVSGASNPLLITNSCPVPVNLRTPVFDSTLSTRHYNQYETYLFPFGYYAMDILGYSGDGTTHSAGGNIWNIYGDTSVGLVSPRVMLGDTGESSVKSRASDGLYSTAWGLNTFAYGDYSTAGGSYCVVSPIGNSGVSIGSGNAVEAAYGSAVGGADNIVSEDYGSVAGGYSNRVSGMYGLAGNRMTSVGGYPYHFVITQRVETSGTCQYVATSDKCTATIVNASSGYNRLYVYADDPWINYVLTSNPENEFNADYSVVLYGWDGKNGGPAHIDTPLLDSVEAKVASVTPSAGGGCYITLASSVSGDVYGGLVSVIRTSDSDTLGRGYASTAFGLGTVAGGAAQTVVGKYNIPMYDPDGYNFIVGCGTQTAHTNSLFSGTSGTFITHSFMNSGSFAEISYVSVTGDAQYGHVNAVAKTYVSVTASYVSSMYLSGENAELASRYDADDLNPVIGRLSLCSDGTNLFSASLSANSGVVGIFASSDDLVYVENQGIGYYSGSTFIGFPASPYSVGILGSYVNVSSENNVSITSQNSVFMEFGSLQLRGDTYGTLTADCYARSFGITSETVYAAYPYSAHSGFYFSNINKYIRSIFSSAYMLDGYLWGFEMSPICGVLKPEAVGASTTYIPNMDTVIPVTAWKSNGSSTDSVTRYLVTTDYLNAYGKTLSDKITTVSDSVTALSEKTDCTLINDPAFAPDQTTYIDKYTNNSGIAYISEINSLFGDDGQEFGSRFLRSEGGVGCVNVSSVSRYLDGYASGSSVYVATAYDVSLSAVYIQPVYSQAIKWAMLTGYGNLWNFTMHINLYVLSQALCPYINTSNVFTDIGASQSNDITLSFASKYLYPMTTTNPNAPESESESPVFTVSHSVLPGVSVGGYITYATVQYVAVNEAKARWRLRVRTTAPSFSELFSTSGVSTDWWHFTVPVNARYKEA